MRSALIWRGCAATLLLAVVATPAAATRGPVLFKANTAHPTIVAKDRNEKESASAESRPQSTCKPAIKPMTEGRVPRNDNCPKPKPILM